MKKLLTLILLALAIQTQAQINVSATVTATGITWNYDTTGIDFGFRCNVYVRDMDVQNQGFYCVAAYCPYQDGSSGTLIPVDVRGTFQSYFVQPPSTVTICGCYVYPINPFMSVHHYRFYANLTNNTQFTKDIIVDTGTGVVTGGGTTSTPFTPLKPRKGKK